MIAIFSKERGISLIEAVVALAVMAFGMMGVAGLQASLRQNADLARQRSEAVRIAQADIEKARGFTVVQSINGKISYDDLTIGIVTSAVAGYESSSTTYTRKTTITGEASQNIKHIASEVSWTDRSNSSQSVKLISSVHRISPEIAAALSVSGSGNPGQLPGGRHSSVPRDAILDPNSPNLSNFTPPGGNGFVWVFNNTTGYITSICSNNTCITTNSRLLSGHISFATGNPQPTPKIAESPTLPDVGRPAASPAFAVDVNISETFPVTATVDCFESLSTYFVSYFCAIPVDNGQSNKWSGQSNLVFASISTQASDVDLTHFKVCRYTPFEGSPASPPTGPNEVHPQVYSQVTESLINQNFLIISAGDGSIAYNCPIDFVPSSPAKNLINTATWLHQPLN